MPGFRITFTDPEDFGATRKAEAWLQERGYSVGTMCGNLPRAIKRGDFDIGKYRNLSASDLNQMDGSLTGDPRSGPVEIGLLATTPKQGA